MGIEPTLSAWEAEVLPLNYTRSYRLGSLSVTNKIVTIPEISFTVINNIRTPR